MERISKISISESGDYVLVPIEVWNNTQTGSFKDEVPSCSDIGDLIRLNRNFKFLTKKELASKAGILPCQISNFENKKRVPRPETIRKIANILGEDFLMKALDMLRNP